MRIIVIVVALLSIGCASKELVRTSYETPMTWEHQAQLAEEFVALIVSNYPPASSTLLFQPSGPIGRAVNDRLRQLGYGVSRFSGGSTLAYTLEPYAQHGFHLSVRVDDWQADRLYQEDFEGELKSRSGYTIRSENRFANATPSVKTVQQGSTPMISEKAQSSVVQPAAPVLQAAAETEWAVQVIAGNEIDELQKVTAQLIAAGYKVQVLEKPGSVLSLVQIIGLNIADAKEALKQQRAGGFKDAFLIKRTVERQTEQQLTKAAPILKPEIPTLITAATAADKPEASHCVHVEIETGSLRENARRLLGRCGYELGTWKLGSSYLEDWVIQRPYSVVVKDGLSGVLGLLKHNYLIEGTIKPFTQTVDFQSVEGTL